MSRQVDDQTFEKFQSTLIDYTINWGDSWLGSDTISTSTWAITPSDLVEVTNTSDDDNATIWVSGGVVDTVYTLLNQITTAGGRIDKRPIYLRIKADDS